MNSNLIHNIFENTLLGLDIAFQVKHIATYPITSCSFGDKTNQVFAQNQDFDQIPIQNAGGKFLGVLERTSSNENSEANVEQHITPLSDELLVSGYFSLRKFLPLMRDRSYFLVLNDNKIEGLVTRSDLLKLPVRSLIFTLITHLEMLMMEEISQKGLTDEEILAKLSDGRKEKVETKQKNHKKGRSELNLLEFTDFADKPDLLKKLDIVNKSQKHNLTKVGELRDSVFHAGDYAYGKNSLIEFLDTFDRLEQGIKDFKVLYNGKEVS